MDYIMATLKTANGTNKYFDDNSREDVINYILRCDKTIHNLYGSNMRDICSAPTVMNNTAEMFSKASGVKLRHFIVSFEPTEVSDPIVAMDGHRYYGKRQEFNTFKSYIKRVLADYGIYTLMYVSNK